MEHYLFQSDSETDERGRPTGTYCIIRYSYSGSIIDRSRGILWATGLSLEEVSVMADRLNKEADERRNQDDE